MTFAPTQAMEDHAPKSAIDPSCDEALTHPWNIYRQLRSLGPGVWLKKNYMFAGARYHSVIRGLKNTETVSSASVVTMKDEMNQVLTRQTALR